MDTETSTAAVALTVKPSVDPKIAIAAAVALTGAVAVVAFVKWRKAKQASAEAEETE